MKTSELRFRQTYVEDPQHTLKKYVFLFVRRSSGNVRRDFHIIYSSCPSAAYDQFLEFCEIKKWNEVSVLSFSRIVEGFREVRNG